jgi:hypothetical protein
VVDAELHDWSGDFLAGGKRAWNCHCESFAVHARLVGLFVTNNDTGKGNYGACDFVPGFKSRMPSEIINIKNKIDPQIMHLADKRTAGC